MPLVYEDEDDDWAEKSSIKIVSADEIRDLMEGSDVVLSF
jgi:tRNA 2-thiouridine synthesizing protein C